MSANRITTCPKCWTKHIKEKGDLIEKANKSYGKIPAADYELLQNKIRNKQIEETLEEYGEIGITGYNFKVDYGARCRKCGFEWSFTTIEKVKIDEQEEGRTTASGPDAETDESQIGGKQETT
jgi:predicted Zn-ribbon and HTH transcriptional regulator